MADSGTSITGISSFGAPEFYAANEYQNIFQILDNVTKVAGHHTLKAGVAFHAAVSTHLRPHAAAELTVTPASSLAFPGKVSPDSGVADFLADQIATAQISNLAGVDQCRWTTAAISRMIGRLCRA